jgi:glycosyltransferase involved in cell wall biosynthesis
MQENRKQTVQMTQSAREPAKPLCESARTRPIVYDIARLATRALNPNPNGIDRVDFAMARHYLGESRRERQALYCSLLGPCLAPAQRAMQAIEEIEACWRESVSPESDPAFEGVIAALGRSGAEAQPARRIVRPRFERAPQNWSALRRWALNPGESLAGVPQGAAYINASQFLLDKPWFTKWLIQRPDVKPIFFVHDLLTVDCPEFFWEDEAKKGPRRLSAIVRLGAGAVVGSQALAKRLRAFASSLGRPQLPICVASLPPPPIFTEPASPDPRLAGKSYFVVCGTIEPRKNHLLLLNLWRRLAERHGAATPKLVIIGKRGWLNRNVVDMMSRCPALRANVTEASGLSTPGLRSLLAGARALLMPSFAEGYGLPVAEAIAARIPVIASDLEVFREFGGDGPLYLDPLDGIGWLQAIEAFAEEHSPAREDALARVSRVRLGGAREFFSTVDAFIDAL